MTTTPGWYPDPAGGSGQRYFDGTQWTDQFAAAPPAEPSPQRKGVSVAAKITIAIAAAFAVVVVIGIVIGRGDDPAKPPPLTPDQQFNASIADIPMHGDEPWVVARSACMAFDRAPDTSVDEARRTLALQKGWTLKQAGKFLDAATTRYCPHYRFGS